MRDFNWAEKAELRKWKSPPSSCTDELLEVQKSGQFPDESVRIKVTRIHYAISQTY
jgi:hypothetical protein